MMTKAIAPLLLAITAFAILGCNSQDAKDLSTDAGKLAETAGRSAANASVAVKVNTVLGLRKGVDMTGLRVEAEGDVVTIGGHVKTKKEKTLILELARETRGVEKVIDKINVKQ